MDARWKAEEVAMDAQTTLNPEVIPDSIEAVVGWKGMTLLADGRLMSPSTGDAWEPNEPFKADCRGTHGTWEWAAVDRSWDGVFMPDTTQWATPMPEIILPRGLSWKLILIPFLHDVAGNGCSCGVYIADSQREASNYGQIMTEMAGWGTTTVHGAGWRCEFAYPKRIVVETEKQRSKIQDYGVPVVLKSELEENVLLPGQAGGSYKKDAKIWLGIAAGLGVASALEAGVAFYFGGLLAQIFAISLFSLFAVCLTLAIVCDQVGD